MLDKNNSEFVPAIGEIKMTEYLVTLRSNGVNSHIYYMAVQANSSYDARIQSYNDDEDGKLTVIDVQHLTKDLMAAIHNQFFNSRR